MVPLGGIGGMKPWNEISLERLAGNVEFGFAKLNQRAEYIVVGRYLRVVKTIGFCKGHHYLFH